MAVDPGPYRLERDRIPGPAGRGVVVDGRTRQVPTVYRAGHEAARRDDRDAADNYVRHTLIGDPDADAVVEALAPFDQTVVHRFIRAAMEREEDGLRDAPPVLGDFFDRISVPPPWFDRAEMLPGMRAYHRDSDLFIAAHVAGVLVEGFATTISRPFFMTGRLTGYGVRRLRQNNRHLIEICLPGGLDRHGEGWKLSVRIRLVHAQLRRLLRNEGVWDAEAWGAPLSAAQMAFASAAFSALLLDKAEMLGVRLDRAARDGFIAIWRYTAWLFGVPEEILFRNYREARELCRVGFACEPPPDLESVAMANGLINSAPLIVGAQDPAERAAFVRFVYRISRALIGDELADRFRYPRQRTAGLLPLMRVQRRLQKLGDRLVPGRGAARHAGNFVTLLERAIVDDASISYRLPDNVDADAATPW